MAYDPELVLKVNEMFHDVQNAHYDKIHPEIMNDEVRRWESVAQRLLGGPRDGRGGVRMMDIGSGTGFVGLRFGPVLRAEDHLTCADLSANMLTVCEEKLRGAGLKCGMDFRKLDGRTIGREGDGFDVITMNSVLHHLPDVEGTMRELDGLLVPGGVLVIAHEPNQIFANSTLMTVNQKMFASMQRGWGACRWRSRAAAGAVLRGLGLKKKVAASAAVGTEGAGVESNELLDDARVGQIINGRLVEMGLVERPLTMEELFAITDLHDHRDGESHKTGFGFNMYELTRRVLPEFTVEFFESYNHLSFLSGSTAGARRYDAVLAKLLPKHGATFFTALRKRGEAKAAGGWKGKPVAQATGVGQ